MTKQEEARTDSDMTKLELLKLYIDIYKNHFELWLKGYVVYLAIVGAASGFIFGKDTSPDSRLFLLLFVITVSLISLAAWFIGLRWVNCFSEALNRVALPDTPPLALKAFRMCVILGAVGSLVILFGTLVLYTKGI